MSEESKACSVPASSEPTATPATVPVWMFMATIVLVFLGLVWFDKQSGWFDANVYAPFGSSDQLDAYQPRTGGDGGKGKKTYETYCGSCHGNDGAGKAGQAPALAGSEFVIAKGAHRLMLVPLEGVGGPIKVKGQDFNLNMAAMGAGLSDKDLAGVLTYIRGAWGNKAEEVSEEDVKTVRAEVGKKPPLSGEEFMKLPE